jgi:hypothetical protein
MFPYHGTIYRCSTTQTTDVAMPLFHDKVIKIAYNTFIVTKKVLIKADKNILYVVGYI